MNLYLAAAGGLSILLGLAHTIIGEYLIFRRLRSKAATASTPDMLPVRHLAALWSSWHLLTLLAGGIGSVLIWMAGQPPAANLAVLKAILAATFLASAVFWILGTRGRHPAWLVFLTIAILIQVSQP